VAPVDRPLHHWIAAIRALAGQPEDIRRAAVLAAWDELPPDERFLFNKLLTGGWRIGVARGLVVRALSRATGQDEAALTHRLMGGWTPERMTWATLIETRDPGADQSRPYPFALAQPLDDPASLGDPALWRAEDKWDGIRAQLIRRGGRHWLWSRGEELITDRFPELATSLDHLPDGTVIDGELLVWDGDRPAPFARLQPRINRQAPGRRLLAEAPVVLMAYDLLEESGEDLRALPFDLRRARLAHLLATPRPGLRHQPPHGPGDLAALRQGARARGAEGLMLKRCDSPYHAGRRTGGWWKWKLDPYSVDAVMVYAQAGHGRRADLFTDYTLAVWHQGTLVPVTKAYSGLTDQEFAEVTAFVRANTLQRFGPVRQVRPELVFEIGFEGLQPSPRHKAGLALRFPRILRWRRDKPASEADRLDSLRALLTPRP
jgi:DNA ligase-1